MHHLKNDFASSFPLCKFCNECELTWWSHYMTTMRLSDKWKITRSFLFKNLLQSDDFLFENLSIKSVLIIKFSWLWHDWYPLTKLNNTAFDMSINTVKNQKKWFQCKVKLVYFKHLSSCESTFYNHLVSILVWYLNCIYNIKLRGILVKPSHAM